MSESHENLSVDSVHWIEFKHGSRIAQEDKE